MDALNKNTFADSKTVRGITLPLDYRKFIKTIGVLIINLIPSTNPHNIKPHNLYSDFEYRYNIPIHIFDRFTFEALSHELDTIPDFLTYLNKREIVLTKHCTTKPTELDLLAFYKTNPGDFDRSIKTGDTITKAKKR